jgi:hypothetical protein
VKDNSGKLVILGIAVAALTAAGFAWWYHYQQGRRALTYWGAEEAELIRRAPRVELLRLSSPSPSAADSPSSNQSVLGRDITDRRDLAQARGLVHARQALISDASFLWDSNAPAAPVWEYALRFSDGARTVTLVFDLEQGYARSASSAAPVKLGPTLARGLEKFFGEQYAVAEGPPNKP